MDFGPSWRGDDSFVWVLAALPGLDTTDDAFAVSGDDSFGGEVALKFEKFFVRGTLARAVSC